MNVHKIQERSVDDLSAIRRLKKGGIGGNSFSPDGQYLASTAPVHGRIAGGLYLTAKGSTSNNLLAQLDYWMVDNPVWSPDGDWLAFNEINTDDFFSNSTLALMDPSTCQIIPLSGIEGTVQQWIP
jgi:Tol biopolymer transport system component